MKNKSKAEKNGQKKGEKKEYDCKSETTVFTASAIKTKAKKMLYAYISLRHTELNKCMGDEESTKSRRRRREEKTSASTDDSASCVCTRRVVHTKTPFDRLI